MGSLPPVSPAKSKRKSRFGQKPIKPSSAETRKVPLGPNAEDPARNQVGGGPSDAMPACSMYMI